MNAQSLLLWGRNPAVTQQPLLPIVAAVRRRGGRAILVDPVTTATVKCVDRHIQPAPGRDFWLALAVASRIFERGWEDAEFLRQHADGVEAFQTLVARWSVSTLLEAADVTLAEVDLLAECLTQTRPAAILLGWGLHRWRNAHLTIRAIDALGAISGNVGVAGGGVSQGFDEWMPFDVSLRGEALAPARRRFSMPRIGSEIQRASNPAIEMLFVTGGNPAAMAPDSAAVRRAFQSVPFVVYAGQFMDDTADLADLFLPTTTYLEERDVVASYGHDVVGPVNPAIQPLGEARSHFRIFAHLARRLAIDPFEGRSEREWLPLLASPLLRKGVTFSQIEQGPIRFGLSGVPFSTREFPTPTGRFQLLEESDWEPPGERSRHWPYALLSTSPAGRLGSEWLTDEHERLPILVLSLAEGERLGLHGEQRVRVVSPRGTLDAQLQLDPTQRDDVAVMPRGGWAKLGHGVNQLTHDHVSRVGEGAAFYETRVRVHAIGAGE